MRPLRGCLHFGVVLLCCFAPRVLAGNAELSDVQSLAAQQFEETAEYHKRGGVNEACGVSVSYSADVEHFDVATWAEHRDPSDDAQRTAAKIAELDEYSALRRVTGTCAVSLNAIASLCSTEWRELVVREVKGAHCALRGHLPATPGELPSVHLRRNLSFKDGIITFHAAPNLGNEEENVRSVLIRALGGKSGAPFKVSNVKEVGEPCASGDECESALCRSRVCTACGVKGAACGSGLTCYASRCRTKGYMIGLTSSEGREPSKRACLQAGEFTSSGIKCCSGKSQRRNENGHYRNYCL